MATGPRTCQNWQLLFLTLNRLTKNKLYKHLTQWLIWITWNSETQFVPRPAPAPRADATPHMKTYFFSRRFHLLPATSGAGRAAITCNIGICVTLPNMPLSTLTPSVTAQRVIPWKIALWLIGLKNCIMLLFNCGLKADVLRSVFGRCAHKCLV